MKKLSIGFHPNEKRKNPKTQKTQIVMRVIVDGLKREVRLPNVYDLTDKEIQTWNPIIQRIEAKDSDVNDYLSGIIARRKLLDLDILRGNDNLTPTEIVEKLLGQKEVKQEVTVLNYVKRYLREEIENCSNKKVNVIIDNYNMHSLNADKTENMMTKTMLQIGAAFSEMELRQTKERLNSGRAKYIAAGGRLGRKPNSKQTKEDFLQKHKDIVKYLKQGQSVRDIMKLTMRSSGTIQKVKQLELKYMRHFPNPDISRI